MVEDVVLPSYHIVLEAKWLDAKQVRVVHSNGRIFWTLNILDNDTREALRIEVDTSMPDERVIRILEILLF